MNVNEILNEKGIFKNAVKSALVGAALATTSNPLAHADQIVKPSTEVKSSSQVYNEYISMLKRHEGVRLKAYKDHLGHPTIGYGHKILPGEDFSKGITAQQASTMLTNDAMDAYRSALQLMNQRGVKRNETLMRVLPNMVFQMGKRGVSKFNKMWDALAVGDYNEAAKEMLDSTWAKQTPSRAKELANLVRSIK